MTSQNPSLANKCFSYLVLYAVALFLFASASAFAIVSVAAFSDTFKVFSIRSVATAIATGIASTFVGGLAISLARGRGVPTWFMRSFMIGMLFAILYPIPFTIWNWWQGNPFDADFLVLYACLVPIFADASWLKTMWYHRIAKP